MIEIYKADKQTAFKQHGPIPTGNAAAGCCRNKKHGRRDRQNGGFN